MLFLLLGAQGFNLGSRMVARAHITSGLKLSGSASSSGSDFTDRVEKASLADAEDTSGIEVMSSAAINDLKEIYVGESSAVKIVSSDIAPVPVSNPSKGSIYNIKTILAIMLLIVQNSAMIICMR